MVRVLRPTSSGRPSRSNIVTSLASQGQAPRGLGCQGGPVVELAAPVVSPAAQRGRVHMQEHLHPLPTRALRRAPGQEAVGHEDQGVDVGRRAPRLALRLGGRFRGSGHAIAGPAVAHPIARGLQSGNEQRSVLGPADGPGSLARRRPSQDQSSVVFGETVPTRYLTVDGHAHSSAKAGASSTAARTTACRPRRKSRCLPSRGSLCMRKR
jgi:hypothetical protein